GRDRVDVVGAAQAGHAHLLFTGPLQQPEHHVAGAGAAAGPDHRVERLDPFTGLFGVYVRQLAGQAVADDREALASGGHGGASPSYGGRLHTGPRIVMPRRVFAAGCVRSCPPQSSYPTTASASLPMGNLMVRAVARDSSGLGGPLQPAFRGSNCDRDFELWAN